MSLQPLARLQLRLTAWYVATFGIIVLLLGGGLFVVVRRQISRQLDGSLHEATVALARAARIRETESKSARGPVVDAVDELHIPDRTLYLLTPMGEPVKPASADAWIRAAARSAARAGWADGERDLPPSEHTLRLHAERFALSNGQSRVAVAVADRVELEDQYASLIGVFGAAAAAALVLVAFGGYFLARKSMVPVEATIAYMRRFMADAAHELRTPVAVLRSRAEVALQQDRDADSYAEALRAVEAEAQRLGTIIEDLLTLARADAGERPVERRRMYLDDIVVDAAGAARALAEAKGVHLEVQTFEEAPIDGDAVLVRQLVMNLLQNAVKFTPAGGRVAVHVSAPNGQPAVVVEDSGIGVSAGDLPHVFERFYRADPARARGEGAGLGLSIARWIAETHGADIRLTSQIGIGTRAEVRFPRAAPA